jgi:beta-lactam-binding protein with PASTA domain
VFRAIAERVINLSDPLPRPEIQQHYAQQESRGELITVPDVHYMDVAMASSLCADAGLSVQYSGNGTIVIGQNPAAGVQADRNDRIHIVLADPAERKENGNIQTPDLRGLSVRRAINALTVEHLDASIHGSGIVVRQVPQPGEFTRRGNSVVIWCEPRGSVSETVN